MCIRDSTTGDFRVYTENTFKIQHGAEIGIKSITNGAVELYHNGSKKFETTSSGATVIGALAGIGVGTAVAVLRERQYHDTAAGTFTSGADRVRVLNNEEHDGESFCSLDTSTGEFTLPAGTYLIYFEAGAYDVSIHRAKIVTDGGTDKIFGTNVHSHTSYPNGTVSIGFGVVTNSSTEGYYLKHRCTITRTSTGFGRNADFAAEDEFYATVVILRMD